MAERLYCENDSGFPRCWCRLAVGHRGPHEDTRPNGCGHQWPNLSEVTPCVATTLAVLGVVGAPALVRCGLLEAHDGEHRFGISWTDTITPANRCDECGAPAADELRICAE